MIDVANNYFSGLVIKNAAGEQLQGSVGAAKNALKGASGDKEKVRAAAEDFEAVFISQMLKPMFEGVETDPMFGGGAAEETWRSMLVDQYGRIISKSGGVGISKYVQDTLIKIQEGTI